jgi:hypothetical protein
MGRRTRFIVMSWREHDGVNYILFYMSNSRTMNLRVIFLSLFSFTYERYC